MLLNKTNAEQVRYINTKNPEYAYCEAFHKPTCQDGTIVIKDDIITFCFCNEEIPITDECFNMDYNITLIEY